MKKLCALLVITLISLSFLTSASAQRVRFGIKGGVNLPETNFGKIIDGGFSQQHAGFNAGILLNVKLILGFSIQPELVYSQMKMNVVLSEMNPLTLSESVANRATKTIELPLNVQWGIKLGPIRPYAQISPYVGYTISDELAVGESSKNIMACEKIQLGVGLGFGIDIWKFQLSYRYKWKIKDYENNIADQYLGAGKGKILDSEISIALLF